MRAASEPTSVKVLAESLLDDAWQQDAWREGVGGTLTSRFAPVRVRVPRGEANGREYKAEKRLLIEWPEDESEPTKYWLTTVPTDMSFEKVDSCARLLWRIAR